MSTANTTPTELPSTVTRIELEDPEVREVFLIGTAHVSKKSVEDVSVTVAAVEPDTICVELCEARYQNIIQRDSWQKLDIFKVLKEGKAPLLLSSLVMSSFQKRIAETLGVTPGAEMIEGIEQAKARGATLSLADRDIQITLRRTWRRLGLWTRFKMLGQMIGGLFVTDSLDEETIEQLKDEDQLTDMLETLARAFPRVKSTLIDERDTYLAQKIREAEGQRIVAVVGAGHVPGIRSQIHEDHDLTELMEVPKPSIFGTILKWGIPLLIISLLVVGFLRGGLEESITSAWIWFLINGSFSAVGAALALGHPLTVVSAFVAAPITSLNPLVAAGWVAGLVQAWIKRPTVEDLENLPEAITSLKGFWSNPTSRVLLVVVLANLGSTLGTFVAGSLLASRAF